MKILYDPEFIRRLKKSDVRIRKSFREKIAIFQNNPKDPVLDNHPLKKNYQGYQSIDITNDYRAIFRESVQEDDTYVYFTLFGTHDELYNN